jgi:hypothetical protein
VQGCGENKVEDERVWRRIDRLYIESQSGPKRAQCSRQRIRKSQGPSSESDSIEWQLSLCAFDCVTFAYAPIDDAH